jgi:hypothetical protein
LLLLSQAPGPQISPSLAPVSAAPGPEVLVNEQTSSVSASATPGPEVLVNEQTSSVSASVTPGPATLVNEQTSPAPAFAAPGPHLRVRCSNVDIVFRPRRGKLTEKINQPFLGKSEHLCFWWNCRVKHMNEFCSMCLKDSFLHVCYCGEHQLLHSKHSVDNICCSRWIDILPNCEMLLTDFEITTADRAIERAWQLELANICPCTFLRHVLRGKRREKLFRDVNKILFCCVVDHI